ncbi:hypothetical protein OAG68_01350 [bacterium]|nr:hypothetical protein [bacterium]
MQGQDNFHVGFSPNEISESPTDSELLKQIESRVLPPVLEQGPPRFDNLPAYYWARNEELQQRFESAKHHFETASHQAFRGLTLVAGSAGIGKTFIKQDIFSKDYPTETICKFDVKELLESWKDQGATEDRPDLFCGDVVLSRLPAIKNDHSTLLRQFLESQPACFFVIDSLDEVHPDSYEQVLEQIEQFVLESNRPFLHVVVLGRALAFRDYWRDKRDNVLNGRIELFMLQPPQFRTTGDLMVSSWNFHTWQYKLRWQSSGGQPEIMPFKFYTEWVESGFPTSFLSHRVLFDPNKNMHPLVHATIQSWAEKYPVVNSMLSNLAGNGMIREIAERFAHQRRPYDEREVMEAYLGKWLERHTKCENRPSSTKPEHLDLYLQLVEGVAVKYMREGQVDSAGFFAVQENDHIEVEYKGQSMRFPVLRILDRSGLKYHDPRKPGPSTYRFQPIWFHRLLIAKHQDLLLPANR